MTLFLYILLGLFGLFLLFLILLQWMVSEAMNNRFGKSAGHRATIVHRIFFWVVRELPKRKCGGQIPQFKLQ